MSRPEAVRRVAPFWDNFLHLGIVPQLPERESMLAEVKDDPDEGDWFGQSLREIFAVPLVASVGSVDEEFAPRLPWIVDSGASFDVIDRSLVEHLRGKWKIIAPLMSPQLGV